MYIQPNLNSNNIAMQGRWDRFKQKVFDAIPEATFKDPSKKIENLTNYISRPGPNRAIMGGTALLMQPAIDASNKKVDEKTRKISICRTISKIVVGTLVGIAVRGSAYKLVHKMTDIKGTAKCSKKLLPPEIMNWLMEKEGRLEGYRNVISYFTAFLAMLVTNFAIDAPLTALMTNKLKSKFVPDLEQNKEARNV